MVSQYKTKQFKQIQAEWYEKLKDDGFEDIEDTESSREFLKVWHSSYFKVEKRRHDFIFQEEYFHKAKQFLSEYSGCPLVFHDEFQEEIWRLHAEGLSFRDIANKMKAKGYRTNKDYVNQIINSLKKLMDGN